uniref:non-specific serine/threonine protein kinase n=1 Tax=Astyanax mexicanus TaxID=7994 RepID=A0A8B9RJA8_ASTMX
MDTDKVLRSLGFKVLKNIGAGCFSQVKLAKSKRHRKKVAIKVVNLRKEDCEWAEKYLLQELAILGKVRHPHIANVLETHVIYEMPSKRVFIVLERAATDLHDKIVELGCLPKDQAREWFSQLVSAMVYLHQQDIAHRDLKPDNILLTADNQIKLTDFGLACFSKGSTELSDSSVGTMIYAAPEVLGCKSYDPKKSDVWSLGIVLFAMITGQLPFYGERLKNVMRAQKEPITYPTEATMDKSCRSLISHMLTYDPSARPSMEEVAKHSWLQARRESSIVGRFVVDVLDKDEEQEGESSEDIRSENAEEKMEEEDISPSQTSLRAALKRATKVFSPLCRPSQSLRSVFKKIFRRTIRT